MFMEKMVKLASTDTRLTATDRPDKGHLSLLAGLPGGLSSLRLISSLAANAQEATCPADGQSGNVFLRENLPSRFFSVTL